MLESESANAVRGRRMVLSSILGAGAVAAVSTASATTPMIQDPLEELWGALQQERAKRRVAGEAGQAGEAEFDLAERNAFRLSERIILEPAQTMAGVVVKLRLLADVEGYQDPHEWEPRNAAPRLVLGLLAELEARLS